MSSHDIINDFKTKYMTEIPPQGEIKIKTYLHNLAQRDINQRKKLFEIAGSHESEKCRKWAANFIRTYTLPSNKQDFIEMWIHNPYENLKDIAKEFVRSPELENKISLRAAVYLLLDEENEAQKVDPNFDHLELYLQKDQLLLAPIAERLTKIRQREFQRVVSDRTISINGIVDENQLVDIISRKSGALSRSLRTKDWDLAWQILKDSSFITVAENLEFFKLSDWEPKSNFEIDIYQSITEYIGFNGWESCNNMIQEMIIQRSYRYKGVQFQVFNLAKNPSLETSLSHFTLKLKEETQEDINKSFVTIFLNNEPFILASIPSSFQITLDKIGLQTLLFPISSFGRDEYKWIKEKVNDLMKADDIYERKVLRYFLALKELATAQARKRFVVKIVSNKNIPPSTSLVTSEKEAEFVIGFDFGNSTTAVCCIRRDNHKFIHGEELLINSNDSAFHKTENGLHLPSLIYYKSGGKILVGLEAEKYRENNETFKLMKRSLRRGWSAGIKVEERRVKAPEATNDFIREVAKRIKLNMKQVYKISITAPVDAPVQYQDVIKMSVASAFNVPETFIEIYDEATAAILGLKENIKPNKSTLVVDIGGGTTDISVISIDDASPKSQIFYRDSRDIGGTDIEAIAFYQCRDQTDEDIPKSSGLITKFMKAKHSLVDKGQMTPIKLSKNSTPMTFTIDEVNLWLKKEEFESKFYSLIENSIHYAKSAGSSNIEQIVLAGGGSKWPLFLNILKKFSKRSKIYHNPDTYAVAKGAARAALGLSLETKLPYSIGILRIDNGKLHFETIIPKGTQIPTNIFTLQIQPIESDVKKVELDFRRRLVKQGGDYFLVYGKNGEPFMRDSQAFTYYEALKDKPILIGVDQNLFLWIDEKGKLFLEEGLSHKSYDLGSVL